MYTDTTLSVPYLSQYRDISNTLNAHRSCGMTCLKMVLEYNKRDESPLEELVSRYIIDETAYGPSGWKHDFFVEFLQKHNLSAHRKEQMSEEGIEEIVQAILQGNPVMASVVQHLFDKKLFHIVLIVGVRMGDNGQTLGFFYHDPGRLVDEAGANQYVSLETFLDYWRRMAIFTNTQK